MSALIASIPDLPGARCKGAADLYEATVNEHTKHTHKAELKHARTAALRLCAECPAAGPCRQWFDGLPVTHRPVGVVAGQVVTASGHPAKTWPKP
ncbi:hypothetical protein [Mycobacterium asiaticum]|uniref:hypothetical protein n=1 Tax=Mycobacterium asiaticum TaxID=1790 RepID=UPI000AA478E2|nr:hypothetical protein [Mycobacterium asiaticum]